MTDNREYFYFLCTLCCHNLLCWNRPILIIKTCKATRFDFVILTLCMRFGEQTCPRLEAPAARLVCVHVCVYVCVCIRYRERPSQALLDCGILPDYRVSSLNVGLTPLLLLSQARSLPPTGYCSSLWFHLPGDAHPNALPPFQSAAIKEPSRVLNHGGLDLREIWIFPSSEEMEMSPVGVSCTNILYRFFFNTAFYFGVRLHCFFCDSKQRYAFYRCSSY